MISSSSSIKIYTDAEGVDKTCLKAWKREIAELVDPRFYRIETIEPNCSFDGRNVSLIIVPGGHAGKEAAGMFSIKDSIQSALNAHSAFLGSCAGAIAVSELVHQEIAGRSANRYHYRSYAEISSLLLNSAPVCVPYFIPEFPYTEENNRAAIKVSWRPDPNQTETKTSSIFYCLGPCFFPSQLDIYETEFYESLASYQTEGTRQSLKLSPEATILLQHKTPYLFTGIHPEIRWEDISELARQDPGLHELKNSDDDQTEMLSSWLTALNIQLRPH